MRKEKKYEVYGINVTEFSLPPATADVIVTKLDRLDYTMRVFVTIKGKHYRRLHDPKYPVVWAEGEFGNIFDTGSREEKDLEAIFKNYCEEVKILQLGGNDKKLIPDNKTKAIEWWNSLSYERKEINILNWTIYTQEKIYQDWTPEQVDKDEYMMEKIYDIQKIKIK